jgi:transposase
MKHRYHIGLDAHSKNSTFAVMDRRGRLVQRATVVTNETELLGFVRSVMGTKALTFEETMLSQWLYVLLKEEVDKLVVCDPKPNKRIGAKTDKIDALELADLLRVGRLKPVFHTCDERAELRTLVSGYYDLVQEIVRAKNRYSALYRQSAIRIGGPKVYADPGMVKALPTRTQRFVAKPLLEQIELLERHKTVYKERFEQNLTRFREMRLIKGIPGFGPIFANQVVGIVVSPWRFATKYKFFSYAMLVKHRQLSDGVAYGNRRAFGNIQLKSIFKMAAKSVFNSDNAFGRKYKRMLSEGYTEKAARNAVARALAATVLGVWKSGKKYNDHHREVGPRPRGCRTKT